jgi:hypothetical protein
MSNPRGYSSLAVRSRRFFTRRAGISRRVPRPNQLRQLATRDCRHGNLLRVQRVVLADETGPRFEGREQ